VLSDRDEHRRLGAERDHDVGLDERRVVRQVNGVDLADVAAGERIRSVDDDGV
jgi:hypothetical protein